MLKAADDPAGSRASGAVAALALSALMAAGCGGKRGDAQSDTAGTLKRAMCEWIVKCGNDYEDVEACVSEPTSSCGMENLEEPLEGAAACASAVRSWSCAGPNGLPTVCEQSLRLIAKRAGQADEGEPCDGARECLSGLYCTTEGAATPACGVCKPLPRAGQACTAATGCVSGLFCNDSGECELRKVPGARCTAVNECGIGFCTDGKCTLPPAANEGEDCSRALCESGTVCAGGMCRARVSLGEACVARQCFRGATCVEGRCREVLGCGLGRAGDGCNSSLHCADGFDCDREQERCVVAEKLVLGAACTSHQACGSGYCGQGTCMPGACSGER